MASIDLDSARAAREAKREANEEAPTVTFKGETFELPVEAPFLWAEHWAQGQVGEGLRVLMGAEEYGRFLALEPTTADMTHLSGQLARVYGVGASLGEYSAGPSTSSNGSKS